MQAFGRNNKTDLLENVFKEKTCNLTRSGKADEKISALQIR